MQVEAILKGNEDPLVLTIRIGHRDRVAKERIRNSACDPFAVWRPAKAGVAIGHAPRRSARRRRNHPDAVILR